MPGLRTGRRLSVDMENPRHSNSSSHNVRMAEVLYLLCRGAQIEHPHMIIVHYVAHQPGPTLRDVKARLIALRGKGMPDLFSWSYKRSYKDTFIWCDLFDDDFIRPLADSGEYVLKAIELFDASQDFSDGEIEFHSARESLSIRSSRVASFRNSLRASSRFEHLHGDSDVPLASENSLVQFCEAGNITSDSSMDFSKQSKRSLSHDRGAPEARNIDPGDDSGSPSFEDFISNKKSGDRVGPTSRSTVSRKESTVAMKRCNSRTHSAYMESSLQRDDTTEVVVSGTPTRPTTTKNDEMLSVVSPSPIASPRSRPARRRTWEKETDKVAIYEDSNDNKSSDDEHCSPRLKVPVREFLPESPVHEDSFLFLLRKATRLGSLRPRLCRGVDVVDSARTKTSKTHFRSKAKEGVNKILFKSPVKHARSLFDEPARKSAGSFVELVRKNHIKLPEKAILPSVAPEKKSVTFADKPVKEFKTLAEYFESKERNFSFPKPMNEPHSVGETPMHHLSFTQPESRRPDGAAVVKDPEEVDSPQCEPRPFERNTLEVTYQETMAVLEQLPTSRRAGKSGAIRRLSLENSEAEVGPVSQGEAKKCRSESKGNKQDLKGFSRHSMHSGRDANTQQDFSKSTSLKHRRYNLKEPARGTIVTSETTAATSKTTAASCGVEAPAKTSDEETIETRSIPPKCLRVEEVNIASLVQRPESDSFDFRTSQNGNKQAVKIETPIIENAEATAESTSRPSSNEGFTGWPFEQPVRPNDFKGREDRLLIPGVTHMDWERSFQEAAMRSRPPEDLVLHACLQCGRTFKLDSLQVHMRGCRVINKPKKSLPTQRKKTAFVERSALDVL